MKLPINPLLYLVSLAALGGIVKSVIDYTDTSTVWDAKKRNDIRTENAKLRTSGVSKNASDQRWNYASETFWYQFRDSNFTGKIQQKKVDPGVDTPPPVKAASEIIDLNTVFEVICITSAGDRSGIVIQYKTDVEVPEKMIPKPSEPVVNTVPAGRRGRATALPRAGATSIEAPPHHLQIGEGLWPKYEHVTLKSIDPDARFVTFELKIEDKKDKVKGTYPSQIMAKSVLGLPSGVQEKMLLAVVGRGTAEAANGGNKTDNAAPTGGRDDSWVDTPETTISGEKVNVANKDKEFLEKNGADIFNDDVHMGNYSGGTGELRFRGVEIRKLSPRVRQFGVNEGDVIISINDVKVTGMANAKIVGRRLYNQGVRNFRAEILRGGRIIYRTYAFKK